MATVLERITPKTARKPEAGTVHWFNECIERGKREPFAEIVTMTPALAGMILKNNPDNRSVRPIKVRHYAHDMRDGKWPLNGETVIIAKTGELNDGQHRLQAVVDANVCLPMTLHFGVPRETRTTVDQGAARGAGAYLRMDGMPYAEVSATVAKLILGYEEGDGSTLAVRFVTNADQYARAHRDIGIREAVEFTSTLTTSARKYIAHTLLAFCYYVFAKEDEADAAEFVQQVALGENLKISDPAHVLRNRLLDGAPRDVKIELTFRAWNFYRRGMKVRQSSLAALGNLPAVM